MVWPTDRVEQLKALHASGMVYEDIGKAMGVSRSAVAGQVKRLGWSKPVEAREFVWTDERVAKLRELHATGMNFSCIGQQLGCSKSTVSGKASRLGLVRRDREIPPVYIDKIRAARKAVKAPRETRTFSRIAMTPAVLPVIPHTADNVAPIRDRKPDAPGPYSGTLEQLEQHQCRWPLGPLLARADLFCGEPLSPDRDRDRPPYCACHMARAFAPNQPKKGASSLARSLRRWAA